MKKQVKIFSFILIALILTAVTLISVGAAGSTTYQIKYYGNGGGTDVHYQTATRNKSVELLGNPYERTGYTFKGWATSSSGQVAYSEGQAVINVTRPGRSINLYAVWKVNTYTVCYNSNGGTGRMASGTGTFGSPLKLAANTFTFTGGTFGGWNAHNSAGEWAYSSDGTSDGETGFYVKGTQPAGWSLCTYLDGQSVTNLNVSNNDTLTFVAIWVNEDAPTYTVTFDANTGSGTMDSQTVTQNLPTVLTANAFTLKGHKFAGWSTSAGGDVVYADQDSVMLTTNLTLYAVWTPNQYILRYDANGGDGTMEDTIVTYGVSTALSEPTFTMTGHHVSGWYRYRSNDNKWYYTSADGSTSAWYVEGTEPEGYTKNVMNTTSSVSKTSPVDGDIVIVYAVWEVNTFTVHYDANGGHGTMSDDTFTWGVSKNTTKSKFTREGFTFGGWYVERQSDGKWAYSADNGADGSTKFYTKGSQPEGWGLHPYGNGGSIAKTSGVNGDVCTFHAIWENVSTDGKKAIFIGNSFVYYGGVVETGSQKKTDKGWFYQICQANGENCTVYDCTYGSHHLYDFTSSGCESGSCHDGADLLSGISFSSIDYVFFSESGDNNSNFLKDAKAVMKRFTASKTKFYYLAHSYTYSKNHTNIINKLSSLQDLGVNIVVWGKLVDDVIDARTTVSGATVTYKKTTFIKNDGDSFHPNPLAGYIAAQMCYCAVTGKTAVGQMPDVYSIGDTLKYGKSKVGYSAYISTHYTSSSASNFKTVMKSTADIKGLQKLMNKYLAKWGLGIDG